MRMANSDANLPTHAVADGTLYLAFGLTDMKAEINVRRLKWPLSCELIQMCLYPCIQCMHVLVCVCPVLYRKTKVGVQYDMEQLDFRSLLKSSGKKSK